jgi:hypothetical protein
MARLESLQAQLRQNKFIQISAFVVRSVEAVKYFHQVKTTDSAGREKMIWSPLFWLDLVVSMGIGLAYFRDLGDVSQMVLKVKRRNMIRFIRNEYRLLTCLGC